MAETRNDGALDLLPDMPPLKPQKPQRPLNPPKHPRGKIGQKSRKTQNPQAAADRPVARIAVDMPLAHLDRPVRLPGARTARGAQARPGVRVRVRFAGQLTDGFVLDRVESSEHQGRLSYLERVVSAEQVLTPEIAGLARAVADRYAGTLADVLRLAIPQRHAATETAAPAAGRRRRRRDRAATPPAPARTPAPGPGTRRARRSSTRSRRAARPAPPGPRCQARPGRRRSPGRP